MKKSKYDIDDDTPTYIVRRRLADARKEKRIYLIVNIVRVLNGRGCLNVHLSDSEKKELLEKLRLIRSGRKVLAKWLPLGYQTVRFLGLARQFSGRKVRLTKRDIRRIKRAAKFYRDNGDWHSRRQLRSLVLCAKELNLVIEI